MKLVQSVLVESHLPQGAMVVSSDVPMEGPVPVLVLVMRVSAATQVLDG